MSETPERIWAWCFQVSEHGGWGNWGGYARKDNRHALDDRERETGAEYVRADLFDAVKAERDNYKALYEAERDDELLNIARQAGYQDGVEERRRLEARVKALTEALTYISDPISAIQLKAKADGYQVDGLTALQISRDPGHLQYTARAALQENTDA